MTTEDIIKEWNNDSEITEQTLGIAALETPKLHAKYLSIWRKSRAHRDLIKQKIKSISTEIKEHFKNQKAQHIKQHGWKPPEPNGWTPTGRDPTIAQINDYIETVKEIREHNDALIAANIRVEVLDEILKQINNRNWYIQSAIKDREFRHGRN